MKRGNNGKLALTVLLRLDSVRTDVGMPGHIVRLRSGWLHDEVINAFRFLLQEREIRLREKNLNWPTSHFANPFFFPKMFEDGRYSHESVKRWARIIGTPEGSVFDLSAQVNRQISGDRTGLRLSRLSKRSV